MQIERSKEQTAISQHLQQHGKLDAIENMLAVLAEARQAAVSAESYEVYSKHLQQFDLDDIRQAVSALALKRRQEGETAFPDLATIVDAVRAVRNDRLAAERQERERLEDEAEARRRREHPEEYFSVRELIDKVIREKGIQVLPPAKNPESPYCEHCRGVRLDLLNAQELHELANVVEKREQGKNHAA